MQKTLTFTLTTALVWAVGCGAPPSEPSPRYSNTDFERADEVSDLSQEGVSSWDTGALDEPPASPYDYDYQTDTYNLSEGALSGGLGPVAFDTDVVKLGSWSDHDYTEVTTVVDNDQAIGGAAMSILLFYGGLDHEALVPGATLSFENSMPTDPESDLSIDVIGCSGPRDGEWDYYDTPADDVQVEVEEGDDPGTVVLKYRASFEDYTGVRSNVTGSFTYQLP